MRIYKYANSYIRAIRVRFVDSYNIMASPIIQALKQVAEEKGIPYESVLETLEVALAAAYRKDFGDKNQNLRVEYDPETGAMRVFDEKLVATDELYEEWQKEQAEREAVRERGEIIAPREIKEGEEEIPRFHPKLNLSLTEAQKIKPDAQVGETLRLELSVPGVFGRMAAQTAKQVIMQKLRETERDIVFNEYKTREKQLVSGMVQRREGNLVFIDLGRAIAILPQEEQTPREDYEPGARIKVLVLSVELTNRGSSIRVSRAHPDILRRFFEMEIPEVAAGTVVVAAVARDAGFRSKVAVYSKESNIDPIGSCIGQRGTRIQTIINELGGEKVDIIEYAEDPAKFISNSLSPAKAISVKINEVLKTALVTVSPDQLSLAIGRNGQNVRLAASLTGWRISVREEAGKVEDSAVALPATEKTEEPKRQETKEVKSQETEKLKNEETEESTK